ncbi:hypothetical protein KI387_019034 [Taxus chinensis]|uniref:Aluminum-activated malate transporter n=1 Tax=Taxus chinensis TaxID=29808 RepID=A0AA38G8G7_TAXCH|nr:hypothetical protein KI387_019034 [Taxus chinensis]
MGDLKAKGSSLEWKINLPEGSVDLKPVQKGIHHRVFDRICKIINGWKRGFFSLCMKIYKVGADDPRRIIHSIKVGMGLAVVSLFYFMHPLFTSVGGTALWAVMTVVVVFEFTAGATLSKGLNRICATLFGGCLAVGVNYVADCAGHEAEPIILGAAVFLQATASTFARFYPMMKARYDYGLMIFILTFSFMTVSGYRVEKLFVQAYERLTTIILGCALCMVISMVVCPIWAGEDLHKLLIRNMEGLGQSCEECVEEYFREEGDSDKEKACKGYKCVLNSKSTEEALANFARWEPAHGQFGFRYPWVQYVKIGAAMRYCAYCVEALNGCINSETMAPPSVRSYLREPCMKIASECSKILKELSENITTMTRTTNVDLMIDRLNATVEELQICLTSQPELFIDRKRWQLIVDESLQAQSGHAGIQACQAKNLLQFNTVKQVENDPHKDPLNFMDSLALATVACLLREIVARLGTVIEAVEELGERANFKSVDNNKQTNTVLAAAKEPPPPPPLKQVHLDLDNGHHSNVIPNKG